MKNYRTATRVAARATIRTAAVTLACQSLAVLGMDMGHAPRMALLATIALLGCWVAFSGLTPPQANPRQEGTSCTPTIPRRTRPAPASRRPAKETVAA